MAAPEPAACSDSPPPAEVLLLLGSLGLSLLALLLWAGYRLSRTPPRSAPSLPTPVGLAPTAATLSLPPGPAGDPATRRTPGGRDQPSGRRRFGPPVTTGLVLRSPTAARLSGDRDSVGRDAGARRPTGRSDRPTPGGKEEDRQPVAVATPQQGRGAGGGAAALGGSLGLEDLSPGQGSFQPLPVPARAGGGGDGRD